MQIVLFNMDSDKKKVEQTTENPEQTTENPEQSSSSTSDNSLQVKQFGYVRLHPFAKYPLKVRYAFLISNILCVTDEEEIKFSKCLSYVITDLTENAFINNQYDRFEILAQLSVLLSNVPVLVKKYHVPVIEKLVKDKSNFLITFNAGKILREGDMVDVGMIKITYLINTRITIYLPKPDFKIILEFLLESGCVFYVKVS